VQCQDAKSPLLTEGLDPFHAAILEKLAAKANGPAVVVLGPVSYLQVGMDEGVRLALLLELTATILESGAWQLAGLPDQLYAKGSSLRWEWPGDWDRGSWPDKSLVERIPEDASCIRWSAASHELDWWSQSQSGRLELLDLEIGHMPSWPMLRLSSLPRSVQLRALKDPVLPEMLEQTALKEQDLGLTRIEGLEGTPSWLISLELEDGHKGMVFSTTSLEHGRFTRAELAALQDSTGLPMVKKNGVVYLGEIPGRVEYRFEAGCSSGGEAAGRRWCVEPLGKKLLAWEISPAETLPPLAASYFTDASFPVILKHYSLFLQLGEVLLELDPDASGGWPESRWTAQSYNIQVERTEAGWQLVGMVDGDSDGEPALYRWQDGSLERISAEGVW
jgi:hypothetical protein